MARKKAETTVVEETTVTKTEEQTTEEASAIEETAAETITEETLPAEAVTDEPVQTEPASESGGETTEEPEEFNIPVSPEPEPEPDVPDEAPRQAERRRNASQRVITIDGKVYSGRGGQTNSITEMRRHIQRGSTLTGNLFAIDQTSGGMPFGIILYEDLRVIIPAGELIDTTKIEVNEDTTLEREVNAVLYGMLDAEIEYIPKGIDAKNGIVTASRREAMEKQARRFYKTPAISGQPLIIENGLAEGRIIRVTLHTVTIDLFGVDITIPGEELSWSWLSDARDVFHVGETVVVRVLKIDCNGNELSVSASIRQAKKDPYIDLTKKLQPGHLYVGEIQAPGYRYIRVTIGDYECSCLYPDWLETVIPGTKVSVRITFINAENRSIRGNITKIIKEV